jgi:hypothetical protein
MKKIFTLLFAVGIFSMAQAQSGNRDNRQFDQRNDQPTDQRDYNSGYGRGKDIVVNDGYYDKGGRYDNNSFSSGRDRDMQIARINREYDFKIQSVRSNFFMGWFQKQKQIRFLQDQRQREISMVYARNNGRDDHSFRHY